MAEGGAGSEPRRWREGELEVHRVDECVEMPCCGFTYDAIHTDADGFYTCPLCEVGSGHDEQTEDAGGE